MICVLLRLAYFIVHNIVQLGSLCFIWQNFTLFNGRVVFHRADVLQFLYPTLFQSQSRLLPCLYCCRLCCYKYRGAGCFLICKFPFFWIYSEEQDCWETIWQVNFQLSEHSEYCLLQWLHQPTLPPTVTQDTFPPHPCKQVLFKEFCMYAILITVKWNLYIVFHNGCNIVFLFVFPLLLEDPSIFHFYQPTESVLLEKKPVHFLHPFTNEFV